MLFCKSALLLATATCVLSQVVPGKVLPTWKQSWQMNLSTAAMICNNTGPVADEFANWRIVDLDVSLEQAASHHWASLEVSPAHSSALCSLSALYLLPPAPLSCRPSLLPSCSSMPPPLLPSLSVEWREECVERH
jgi:hypothetical protein